MSQERPGGLPSPRPNGSADRRPTPAPAQAEEHIAALQRALEQARQQELLLKDQLAKIAVSVPGAIFTFSLRPGGAFCMPFGTPATGELFGVTPETLAADAKPLFDRVDPQDLAGLKESIAESARTMGRWHHQFRYAHPGKGLRRIEGWSVPRAEPDGTTLWSGFAMDVTDRWRADLALRESEELYRSLFNLTPSGVVLLDQAGRILAFNDQAPRQLGYERGEFARLGIGDIDVEEHQSAKVARHLGETAADGRQQFAAAHRTRGGETRQVLVDSRTVDVHGQPHFLAVWQDVTERRLADAALRESEARFRAIFEQAAVGMAEVHVPTGRLLRANDKFCAIVGYTQPELARVAWQDLAGAPGQADPAADPTSLGVGGVSSGQARLQRKGGTPVWVELSLSPMWAAGEPPGSAVAIVKDVTRRRQVEEALARNEQRFRALIEKSADLILVLDGEGRYRFWSPSATELFGWTEEEQLGQSSLDLIHPDDQERAAASLQRLLAAPGSSARDVMRYRHRDGSFRQIEVRARNLLDEPSVQGVVLNSRDVTAERLLEDQFRQAQKLESVGRLAGGVAHDFNNLLTVMLSCADELLGDEELDPAIEREDLEEIRAAAKRASELTRQLLAFARKQVIAPVALDVSAAVRGMEKLLRRVLGEDVELAIRLDPALWTVRCDPGQLEQVLLNLAVNARDAMPRGGTLTIETCNAEVTATPGTEVVPHLGRWARLVVKDTGSGMPEEVRAHLFEPFFTTKRQGLGTGLGLATVHGIVGQAGGHLHVESEVGQGTTFTICFPAIEAERAPSPPPRPAATRGSETVLVVEDDPQVRRVTVRTLEGAGYRVHSASNGTEALQLATGLLEAIDLVVTDVIMPGQSGRAVMSELSRIRPGVRALYVSGYTQDTIASQGVLDEGIQFLPKPFTASALLERVRQVLGR